MKKFVSLALLLFLALGVTFTAYADSALTLFASNVETVNNRLFDVVVYVRCTDNLSAATFELDYDSSLMEYRSVDTEIADGQVKAVNKNGKVKAVFFKGEGVAKNEKIQLFSAKFKSINFGSCDVKISATDCVNDSAKELSCQPVAVCQITVPEKTILGKAPSVRASSCKVLSGDDSYAADDSKTIEDKDKKKDANKTKQESSKSNSGFSVAPDTSYKKYVYIFTLLFLALFVGFVVLIAYVKKLNKKLESKTESEKQDSDENSEETEIYNQYQIPLPPYEDG